ncbi:ATP-dependent Clp protease adaptor ClpS [Nostoc sp.]|uniref:ATP-dependent Clp protease adaptor ClpS n=1 Tax=Nostoc sp. TaxID=1180 RepID=UPI002FFA3DD9
MPLLISVFLCLIIIYLLNRLVKQTNEPILSKKIFTGIETHALIFIDDDISSMETVVNTLVRVIGISEKQAINLMFRIHKEGMAIVWTGDRNSAEQHLTEIQRTGLQCFLTEIVSNNL